MISKSTYEITYTVDNDNEFTKIVLNLKPIKGLMNGFKPVYQAQVSINDFITNDYDDIVDGTVNAKYSMEEISSIYKDQLKKQLRKERKKFKLIKEKMR